MDGSKGIRQVSLRTRLSLWIFLAILGVLPLAGLYAFFSAAHEAHKMQDSLLRQIASMFDRHHLPIPQTSAAMPARSRIDAEDRVFVRALSSSSVTPGRAGNQQEANPLAALPKTMRDGMHTIHIGNETYRVLVSTMGSGERLAVGQEKAFRDEIANDSLRDTLIPFLVLMPILLLVVAFLIRSAFQPIAELCEEIDSRSEEGLHPIVHPTLPVEVMPFVKAINRLLERVEQAMAAQRRFIADAAHELRSPMTALSLQAERLAEAEMPPCARERLDALRCGILRNKALLEQLLALARAQSSATLPGATHSMVSIFHHVLEDLLPLAEEKGIDIGLSSDRDVQVQASETDLVALVQNLVDNAIRYTPAQGQVSLEVTMESNVAVLVVEDNGPGIQEAERERVFEPFYRVPGGNEPGSGLGLAIVQAIASRLGATVQLGFADASARTGLRAMVVFPQVQP